MINSTVRKNNINYSIDKVKIEFMYIKTLQVQQLIDILANESSVMYSFKSKKFNQCKYNYKISCDNGFTPKPRLGERRKSTIFRSCSYRRFAFLSRRKQPGQWHKMRAAVSPDTRRDSNTSDSFSGAPAKTDRLVPHPR